MPELPEVEIVCRNLKQVFGSDSKIKSWRINRKKLRNAIPVSQLNSLVDSKITEVQRRAKYILISFENGSTLLSHLGMTGLWRYEPIGKEETQKHDHLIMELSNGSRLVYNDPRRFGFVEVHKSNEIGARLGKLGAEPISSYQELKPTFIRLKSLHSPIKPALMNQDYIVGVGNIYASEILFLSKISPFRPCDRITEKEYREIFKNMRFVLKKAIQKGGSTIENYRNSFGGEGSFQKEFLVYGKAGEACPNCNRKILQKKQAGRSTFWCKKCQT